MESVKVLINIEEVYFTSESCFSTALTLLTTGVLKINYADHILAGLRIAVVNPNADSHTFSFE